MLSINRLIVISLKKQLAYLQLVIYNNKGYFMGRKEAAQLTALEENYNIRFSSKATATGLRSSIGWPNTVDLLDKKQRFHLQPADTISNTMLVV
jgi:hypothetical protein